MTDMADPPEWTDNDILDGMSARKREPATDIIAVDCADYIRSFEPPDYLIDGLIRTGNLYSLTAMTGHLKTALATLWGLSVAGGHPIGGRETKKCKTLLLSGENDEDQKSRTIATIQEYRINLEPGQFRVISAAQGIGSLLPRIADIFEEHGPFGLVIVDTSAAYFGGEEENSNNDQHQHAAFFREMTTYPGKPAVLVLCHPIKSATRETLLPRGGGAFLAAVDGNLTLWRQAERASLHWLGKYRGASFEPVEFGMRLVALAGMRDRKGRPINSVVIYPMTEYDVIAAAHQEWTDENKVLYHMLHHPGDSLREIAKACNWLGKDDEPLAMKVQRMMIPFCADKLTVMTRNKWALTDKGTEEAKKVK